MFEPLRAGVYAIIMTVSAVTIANTAPEPYQNKVVAVYEDSEDTKCFKIKDSEQQVCYKVELPVEPEESQTLAPSVPEVQKTDDPSGFRQVYQDASKKYGVPWQILEAVHQVETGKDGNTCRKSYAGATGPMQFMPGTWRAYQDDGDGNGSQDICDVDDAIYGAAHLLAASGASEGRIDEALFNYNHSWSYVAKVKDVAQSIGF